jgi:hypothetical protein
MENEGIIREVLEGSCCWLAIILNAEGWALASTSGA